MSLTKNIRISESVRFQIRADAFNLLNHTNFQIGVLDPNVGVNNVIFNVNSATFGQITNTFNLGGLNRVIQVAGRFEF
ncbi:MAG TPA: hypothetical protein VF955_01165 [Pyrinomonadaceae bacterium]